MKFFAIIATAVTAKSIVKRSTDESNSLGYEGVKSGCDSHPDNYDAHLNNNQCSDGLFEDSICSSGFEGGEGVNALAYHQCTCDYGSETDAIIIPTCTWSAHTPSQEDLDLFFPPTQNPFVHTEVSTVAATSSDCPALDDLDITDGFYYCTDERTCEVRCNRGYIPSGIRNNIGIKTVRTCDELENQWSEAPFTVCVAFEDFCDFNADVETIRADEKAEISVATISGPTGVNPRVIGSKVVNAECVPQHHIFSGTNEPMIQLRCSCRYGKSTYFCLRNHESLSTVGTCTKASWADSLTGGV